jgi:hypothetical protein
MNIRSRSLGVLIYVLPTLHLCACATILPMGDLKLINLGYMMIIDFPLAYFLALFLVGDRSPRSLVVPALRDGVVVSDRSWSA